MREKSKSCPSIQLAAITDTDFAEKGNATMAMSNDVAVSDGSQYLAARTYCPPVQSVPLFDIQRQMEPLRSEIDAAISSVFDSGQFVLGPEVKTLESKIAVCCQSNFAVGCASGSDALLLALMAAEIGAGDEVIVPSYTFFSTASAVTRRTRGESPGKWPRRAPDVLGVRGNKAPKASKCAQFTSLPTMPGS